MRQDVSTEDVSTEEDNNPGATVLRTYRVRRRLAGKGDEKGTYSRACWKELWGGRV